MRIEKLIALSFVLMLIVTACADVPGVEFREPTATFEVEVDVEGDVIATLSEDQLEDIAEQVATRMPPPVIIVEPTAATLPEIEVVPMQETPVPGNVIVPGVELTALPPALSDPGLIPQTGEDHEELIQGQVSPEPFEAVVVEPNLLTLREGDYIVFLEELGRLRFTAADMANYLLRLSFERTDSIGLNAWPSTPEEAALAFTGNAAYAHRFEQNEFGGWHLREGDIVSVVIPQNVIFEGYNDFGTPNQTPLQGGRAICWTAVSTNNTSWRSWVIGGTFWLPDTKDNLNLQQTAQKVLSEQEPFQSSVRGSCWPVGFQP